MLFLILQWEESLQQHLNILSKRINKELHNEVINNLIEKAQSLIVGELYLTLDFSNEK